MAEQLMRSQLGTTAMTKRPWARAWGWREDLVPVCQDTPHDAPKTVMMVCLVQRVRLTTGNSQVRQPALSRWHGLLQTPH